MKSQLKVLTCLSLALFASAPTQAVVTSDFYGFLKASYLSSDNSVSSFGNDSLQAPTEAQNLHTNEATGSQQTSAYKNKAKNGFQIAQTRLGSVIKKSEKLSARIEFDMVDFTNNPISKNDARVRLAEIYYNFTNNFSVRFGQGWTTFWSMAPHNYNPVAQNFRSGSTGFLAQQVELKYTMSEFTFFVALSQKGRNLTGYAKSTGAATDPLIQDASNRGLPGAVGKVEYNVPGMKIGVAGTSAKFEYDEVSYVNGAGASQRGKNTHSYGGKAYYQGQFNKLELRTEFYQGSNLNDLGYLTLADHTVSTGKNRDIKELGYYVSGKYTFENTDSVNFNYGEAHITSKTQYIANSKLVGNRILRAGYAHTFEEALQGFVELTQFRSDYSKAAGGKKISASEAIMGEVGMMYTF